MAAHSVESYWKEGQAILAKRRGDQLAKGNLDASREVINYYRRMHEDFTKSAR